MFNKILLPVDGSKSCKKSWEYAKDLAKKYDSKIEILYVNEYVWLDTENSTCDEDKNCKEINIIDTCDTSMKGSDIPSKKKRKKSKKDLVCNIKNEVMEYFKDYSDNVTIKILDGDAAYKIIKISETKDFDLIVMCTHGMNAFKRFNLGSVTNKVVHHAKVPVLVVR